MKKARAEDASIFRDAVRDVRPLPPPDRVAPARKAVSPFPKRGPSPYAAPAPDDDAGDTEAASYLRPGLPRDTLKKLRRAHWEIEETLDLHGLTGDEAARQMVAFLEACRDRGARCIRVVHGKGLGVLKGRIRRLLARRDEVLAFAEPGAAEGGSGAVVVLLGA